MKQSGTSFNHRTTYHQLVGTYLHTGKSIIEKNTLINQQTPSSQYQYTNKSILTNNNRSLNMYNKPAYNQSQLCCKTTDAYLLKETWQGVQNHFLFIQIATFASVPVPTGIYPPPVFRIRIRVDPYSNRRLDPDPDPAGKI